VEIFQKFYATINTQCNLLSIESHYQCIELQQGARLIEESDKSCWNDVGNKKKFWKDLILTKEYWTDSVQLVLCYTKLQLPSK